MIFHSFTMIYCFQSVNKLSEKLSYEFLHFIIHATQNKRKVNIAFSGGNTPKMLFESIAANQHKAGAENVWEKIHLYWVDERCVPPDHPDSNYGMTKSSLLDHISIPERNIHRILGENNPFQEAERYTSEIMLNVNQLNGIPEFDWVFLGIGDDGHTASIFPGRLELLDATEICEAVAHPVSGQFRVTITGKTILQAKKITFMATGESKSTVIRQIINNEPAALSYPAAHVQLRRRNTSWYVDEAAAKYIKTACRG